MVAFTSCIFSAVYIFAAPGLSTGRGSKILVCETRKFVQINPMLQKIDYRPCLR